MKRVGHLWEQICTFDNAYYAYTKARKTKRYKYDALQFEKDREQNLIKIVDELSSMDYLIGKYKSFTIYEPKKRLILALPFRDRVVQHMVCNYIEPIYERRFYEHSYACRKNKGIHAASNTLHRWLYNLEVLNGQNIYAIKGDIHHYFQSINHQILKEENRYYFKDLNLLTFLDLVIDHNGPLEKDRGIPVGNLTSQLFANVYLNVFDNFIKKELRCAYYDRYMDDFIILSDDLDFLRYVLKESERFLYERLDLFLNPKTTIVSAKNGIDFVGYRHYNSTIKVRKERIRGLNKMFNKYEKGLITDAEFNASVQSRLAHMAHADTYWLRKQYVEELAYITASQ